MFRINLRFKAFGVFLFSGLCLKPMAMADTGIAGATFLRVGAGPRAAAMGEAQVSVVNDAYSSYWNPAGLAALDRCDLEMTYQRSVEDVQEQNLAVAAPLLPRSGIGAYATRVTVAPFAGFDASGNAAEDVDANASVYGLAYGRRLTPRLLMGGAFKVVRSSLGPSNASTHAFDLGALMVFPLRRTSPRPGRNLSLGFALKNWGPALVYDQAKTRLPESYQLGAGFETSFSGRRFTAALDYNRSIADRSSYYTVGQEFWIARLVALRAGYRVGRDENSGVTAGLAVSVRDLQISYAISPFGFLGNAQRLGISYRFGSSVLWPPPPLPATPAVPPTRVNRAPAIAPVSSAVQVSSTPAIAPAAVSPGAAAKSAPLPAAKKSPAVTKPAPSPKTRPHTAPRMPSDVPSLMVWGNRCLKEGRFQEATNAFAQVLKIDPNNTAALDLMRRALNEMDREKRRERGIYE